jgi:FkbM family methyltransferase
MKLINYFGYLFRFLPRFKGKGRLYGLINSVLIKNLKLEEFIVDVPMNDGSCIKVDLRSGTEFGVFYEGNYDPVKLNTLKAIFQGTGNIIDVGANIGFYSVSLAKHISEYRDCKFKVYSFEPMHSNFIALTKNLSFNTLEAFSVTVNLGLSNVLINDVLLTLREDFNNGALTGNAAITTNPLFDSGFRSVAISLIPLDYWIESLGIDSFPVEIIKVDIEGHEDLFFRGALKTINQWRPTILMEVNKPYYHARQTSISAAFEGLIPDDYYLFRYRFYKWRMISSFDQCKNIDDVLMIPKENFSTLRNLINIVR